MKSEKLHDDPPPAKQSKGAAECEAQKRERERVCKHTPKISVLGGVILVWRRLLASFNSITRIRCWRKPVSIVI